MRTTRGLDLSYRPVSYWEHADPVSAITNDIKGEIRRRAARHALRRGDPVAPWVLRPLAESPTLRSLLTLGPQAIAGEYLPPDLPGETVIARIVFHTTVGLVVEVRARPEVNGVAYRVVDDLGTEYEVAIARAAGPLELREMIRLFEESRAVGRLGDGLVLPMLDALFPEPPVRLVDWLDWVGAVRDLVALDSPLYPDLEPYVKQTVDGWLVRRRRRPYKTDPRAVSPEAGDSATGADPEEAGDAREDGEEAVDELLWRWLAMARQPWSAARGWGGAVEADELRRYVSGHLRELGSLPSGVHDIGDLGDLSPLQSWRTYRRRDARRCVDFDALTDEARLLERVLVEGVEVRALSSDVAGRMLANIPAYRFAGRYYVVDGESFDLAGPFWEESDIEDHFLEAVVERGTRVAYQEWDSGGPGAGAGCTTVYRYGGLYFVSHDAGLDGPYDDRQTAVDEFQIDRVGAATVEIWDEDRGVVYPQPAGAPVEDAAQAIAPSTPGESATSTAQLTLAL